MSWESDILKKLRYERKLTQAQFSEWLEIPKRTYEKWESGESTPPTWVIKLIQFKCDKSTQGEQIRIEEKIIYLLHDEKEMVGITFNSMEELLETKNKRKKIDFYKNRVIYECKKN